MSQQISITQVQFGETYDPQKERRLVQDLTKAQQCINTLVQEFQDLQARVKKLENP